MSDAKHPICVLCRRPIPPDARQSRHHLIPKMRGGKGGETVLLHHICHNEIHAAIGENELALHFNTPQTLRTHPHLKKFINWISKRPPEFYAATPGPRRRRR